MRRRRMKGSQDEILLLIDGTCSLCHWITRFVVKRDPVKRFRFASLQSEAGQHLLKQGGLSRDDLDTFVMIQAGHYDTKSTAALRVLRALGGFWAILYGGMLLPVAIRDRIYDYIAHHRYRWFGRYDQCLLPTPELKSRFIDKGKEVAGDND